ncbi:MAG: hypothetical protein H0U67_07555, partial [Gemmatimonadetes bacterium]|nr:hypothetical protein [Gemmatimonadota bacterium]
ARLRTWRVITRAVAYLLLVLAVYSLLGGTFAFLSGADKSAAAYYGLFSDPFLILFGSLNTALPAFLAWSLGEYLQHVIDGTSRPGHTERLLPLALIAVAAIPLATWLFSTIRIPFDLEMARSGSPVWIMLNMLFYGAFPMAAGAAASIGLAMIVARLTLLIKEEKATV